MTSCDTCRHRSRPQTHPRCKACQCGQQAKYWQESFNEPKQSVYSAVQLWCDDHCFAVQESARVELIG